MTGSTTAAPPRHGPGAGATVPPGSARLLVMPLRAAEEHVLVVVGEADISTADHLRDYLIHALAGRPPALRVELGGLEFCCAGWTHCTTRRKRPGCWYCEDRASAVLSRCLRSRAGRPVATTISPRPPAAAGSIRSHVPQHEPPRHPTTVAGAAGQRVVVGPGRNLPVQLARRGALDEKEAW